MRFGIPIRDLNILIKMEDCTLKIIEGNWGVFHKSFINHMHSYYELHYVTGGRGTLITESLEMPLSAGCFYLLPPRTNHEQWSDPESLLEEYHLAFELVSKSEEAYIWKHLLYNGFYHTQQYELEALFCNIACETEQKQYGYSELIYQNIQAIFITLVRSLTNLNNALSTPSINLDDRRMILIDEAFLFGYKTITLSSLSDQLKLSTRQTQRFIKDKYGVSFSTQKFQSKLSHAAMLLASTKLSTEEICFDVGYKSYSFFCKAFKQRYNETPNNYRKAHFRG